MLERGVFMAAAARLGEGGVKRLFEFAGKRRHFLLLRARATHGQLRLNVVPLRPIIKLVPVATGKITLMSRGCFIA
jgi:hypothetical protein